MFAVVESGSITSMLKAIKVLRSVTINITSIFTLWSESERNAIGVYTIEIDDTNKKDTEWYINTNITYYDHRQIK